MGAPVSMGRLAAQMDGDMDRIARTLVGHFSAVSPEGHLTRSNYMSEGHVRLVARTLGWTPDDARQLLLTRLWKHLFPG